MNWLRQAAWIYKDSQPDYPKLARYNIGTVYLDPRSENAAATIAQLDTRALQAGIYEVPQWYGQPTPEEFAAQVSAHIGALIPQAYPLPTQSKGHPVMLDIEAMTVEWQQEAIAAYRSKRATRETAYTNEPFKDGTVVPIPDLAAAGFHWYPQLYHGDMSPADGAAVLLELARWGYPATQLHPFYDGARFPIDARDGCIFTLERLP